MQSSKLLAVAALSAALFSAPAAYAGVFDWNFGTTAAGTFTTGGPASEPGFFLLTDFTITSFDDHILGPLAVVGVEANSPADFSPDASFNPTTGAFENGGFFHDPGTTKLGGTIGGKPVKDIEGGGFAPGSGHVLVVDFVGGTILEETNLPAVTVTPVPEPTTLSLLGVGLAAIGLRRRKAKTV